MYLCRPFRCTVFANSSVNTSVYPWPLVARASRHSRTCAVRSLPPGRRQPEMCDTSTKPRLTHLHTGRSTERNGTQQHRAEQHTPVANSAAQGIGKHATCLLNDKPTVGGEFRPRQTRQLPRAVDLKGRLLSCQSY